MRESAQSWRELLVDVKRRGLAIAPEIAVGDGALAFWKALDEVLPTNRHQRRWLHEAANLLGMVSKSVQDAMKADIREISAAPTRAAAEAAIAVFVEKYGARYRKAAECLTRDRDALLAFFDFPPSTGITCGPRTRSRPPSPRCGTGPFEPGAPCRPPRPS